MIFITSWMHGGRIDCEAGQLRVVGRGQPKFVERVDEVTFNGARALRAGKQVYYATHVGLFQLTARGVELLRVMPGIDVRRDILDFTPMRLALPEHGRVQRVPQSIISGKRLALKLPA